MSTIKMIKNIFIIGDSQIGYTSLCKDIEKVGVPLRYGSHRLSRLGYDVNFLWQTARTAYGVDFDYIKKLLKNNISDLGENSVIVSEFGGMDIVMQYNKKYKDFDDTIYKYTDEVIRFCKEYNTKLIFICPWWLYEEDDIYQPWLDMTELIKKISKEKGLPDPIEIMYNVVGRKYDIADDFKHHTPEDSERIVDYVILKVEEAYGS